MCAINYDVEYREAVGIDPECSEYHYNLGNALADKDMLEEAIREYQEALRINPEDEDAQYNLEIVLKKKSN